MNFIKKNLFVVLLVVAIVAVGGYFVWKSGAFGNGQSANVLGGSRNPVDSLSAIGHHITPPPVPLCPLNTPTITITSPSAGQTYAAGRQIAVTWTSCNIPATSAIQIGIHWPASWGTSFGVTNVTTTNSGSYTYTLPSTSDFYTPNGLQSSQSYTISVGTVGHGAVVSTSSSFSIDALGKCTTPLTATVNTAYNGQTVAAGTSNVKIGSYIITNNCTVDPVILGGPVYFVSVANNGAQDYYYKISNVTGVIGGAQVASQSYISAGDTESLYIPYESYEIQPGATIEFDVYGDLDTPNGRIIKMTSVQFGGNDLYNQSQQLSPTPALTGQTITVQ